jgi:hypothetical protein
MPNGDFKLSGVKVRHVIDWTVYGKAVTIPKVLETYPGYTVKNDDTRKRISFLVADGTSYRPWLSVIPRMRTVYSTDPRIQTFNSEFLKANKDKNFGKWDGTEFELLKTYEMEAKDLDDFVYDPILKDLKNLAEDTGKKIATETSDALKPYVQIALLGSVAALLFAILQDE